MLLVFGLHIVALTAWVLSHRKLKSGRDFSSRNKDETKSPSTDSANYIYEGTSDQELMPDNSPRHFVSFLRASAQEFRKGIHEYDWYDETPGKLICRRYWDEWIGHSDDPEYMLRYEFLQVIGGSKACATGRNPEWKLIDYFEAILSHEMRIGSVQKFPERVINYYRNKFKSQELPNAKWECIYLEDFLVRLLSNALVYNMETADSREGNGEIRWARLARFIHANKYQE